MANFPYTPNRIDANTWQVLNKDVRIFIFQGTEKSLIVDTGHDDEDVKSLVEGITDKPVMLVNTHADPDHIGGNSSFDEAWMHSTEIPNYKAHTADSDNARPLSEGDVIDIGGRRFKVILIPGHTPGSIALLDRENRIMLPGDSVASNHPVFMFGNARDLPEYIRSLKMLEAMSDLYDTIYPSHGMLPIGKEAVTAQRDAAEQLLAGKLEPMEHNAGVPAKLYTHGTGMFLM